ncbi:hypothetical protein CEXT_683751 [Caerostris extrusa]|uniref:Uncharacterized protein n=1 Tax=Caerostris extrusa TaxID=172846 RepID=A0AAV4M3S2_CAEEX|nr:hypothetical protein CEXT_683751 [Caerostris extrusa]
MYVWWEGWMDRWIERRKDGFDERKERWIEEWMVLMKGRNDGLKNLRKEGWMDGNKKGRMDLWTEGWNGIR